jgi:hypothetical protein
MSTQIQRRRGTTAEHSTFTGVEGELTVDTTKDTAVVHDGTTVGGHPLQKQYPPLGSAAAPTYTFTGDPNTGIYSPGADQVAVSTGGTGRLFVDSSGRVGVGVTENGSNAKLEVRSTTGSINSATLRVNGGLTTTGAANTGSTLLFAGNIGTGERDFASVFAGKENGTSGNNDSYLAFGTRANGGSVSERLRITSAGLVGIGTSSPSATLHAIGNVYAGASIVGTNDTTGLNWYNNLGLLRIQQGSSQTGYCFDIYKGGTNATKIGFKSDGSAYFAGNVGIGTTTLPANTNLTVLGNFQSGFYRNASSGARGYFINIGSNSSSGLINGAYIFGAIETGDANGNLSFGTRTSGTVTEKVRIDSSGRLLVGTSSAYNTILLGGTTPTTPTFQVVGSSFSDATAAVLRTTAGPAYFTLGCGSSGNVVASDNILGRINFVGYDASAHVTAALIGAEVDGTPGANDMPGRLVFSTTADGANTPTERMRIRNNGEVWINTTSAAGSAPNMLAIKHVGQTDYGLTISNTNTLQGDAVGFFNNSGTRVGVISYTTTATSYVTSSDYRLKENVVAVPDAIDRLQQLRPSRFNFIADPDHTVDGFIAHEVQTIVPEAITGEKDAVDDEGNPEYQGIDQSKLVPLLTAALQEAIGEIESLKARVASS